MWSVYPNFPGNNRAEKKVGACRTDFELDKLSSAVSSQLATFQLNGHAYRILHQDVFDTPHQLIDGKSGFATKVTFNSEQSKRSTWSIRSRRGLRERTTYR